MSVADILKYCVAINYKRENLKKLHFLFQEEKKSIIIMSPESRNGIIPSKFNRS
jgi:hypothetical protein